MEHGSSAGTWRARVKVTIVTRKKPAVVSSLSEKVMEEALKERVGSCHLCQASTARGIW